MLPVVSGKRVTKNQIFTYSLILFFISLLPYILNFSGLFYLSVTVILNSYFCFLSYMLLRSEDTKNSFYAPKLFKFSILYLYLIFLSIVIDSFL